MAVTMTKVELDIASQCELCVSVPRVDFPYCCEAGNCPLSEEQRRVLREHQMIKELRKRNIDTWRQQ